MTGILARTLCLVAALMAPLLWSQPAGAFCEASPTNCNPAAFGDTSIASGGVAQSLFSGTTPINGWAVYNPNASDDLWVSDSTTAAVNGQGSIRVAGNGGGYETPPGYKPAGPVSIVGPTTGDKITARKW